MALERVEAGQTGGLVVARLDRFGRSLIDSLVAIERIQRAGGVFVSVQDGLDLTTDTGRMILRVMHRRARERRPFGAALRRRAADRPGRGGRRAARRAEPGELLCGALAGCFDGTVRMIAGLLGVELEQLEVEASATMDVRGALAIDSDVRVGLQAMQLHVRLRPAENTRPT